jgi:hypothetical protein
VVPTDCLMIQEPCVTRGMSLNVALRSRSPPARNLHPTAKTPNQPQPESYACFFVVLRRTLEASSSLGDLQCCAATSTIAKMVPRVHSRSMRPLASTKQQLLKA